MAETGKKRSGVSWRAVLLGLLIIPINIYWITVVEVQWYTLDGTCLPLFITPVFILFLLSIGNMFFRRLLPDRAFQQGELLTVYIMVVISSTFASHDLLQNLFGTIGHPFRFATPENRWQELFFSSLPNWLFVRDPEVLRGFYQGGVDPFQREILVHWIVPLAGWGAFMFVLAGMMLCMNTLIRKQWTESEKLVFPLVQLPLEMTSPDSSRRFYASRQMWIGFSIAAGIGLLNGLHHLYPSIPYLPGVKQIILNEYTRTRPWNAIGHTPLAMYPFAIGLGYFIPLDLSFSCWFFYVARKLFQVTGAVFGWDAQTNAGFPYFDEQSAGAWIALGLVIIWGSRKYLRDVWRQAWGRHDDTAVSAEARQYRLSFYGLGAGILFLALFSQAMGMAGARGVVMAAIFFGIYFLLSVTMTRVRAELGTPHEIYFVNPHRIMVSLLGVPTIGAANLTIISSMYWFNRCYRSHPMPNQLEGYKMAEGKMRLGPLAAVMMLAAVVGILTTYWANLHVCYEAGAMAKCLGFKYWVGEESFSRLQVWLDSEPTRNATRLCYFAGGFLLVTALRILRGAFIWWPFHHAGYALGVSYAMDYFWFAFFISWLLKALIVHYGGMKLHNQFVPFFLGLILGDFCIGSLWAITGPVLGIQTYKVFL